MRIGISSRGLGSVVKKNGEHIVQGDYMIFCWDIVHSPSVPGAWLMHQSGLAIPGQSPLTENRTQPLNSTAEQERVLRFMRKPGI